MDKVKKTLIMGASENPERYSNKAAHALVNNGHIIRQFGKKAGTVAEQIIDTETKHYHNIDTVTLYLNPNHQAEYYDYILSLKPQRVVFNPGTENPPFYEILQKNNIEAIEACTLVLLATGQY